LSNGFPLSNQRPQLRQFSTESPESERKISISFEPQLGQGGNADKWSPSSVLATKAPPKAYSKSIFQQEFRPG
jgi:hypothetical protein